MKDLEFGCLLQSDNHLTKEREDPGLQDILVQQCPPN
jgi:hypothetical protein